MPQIVGVNVAAPGLAVTSIRICAEKGGSVVILVFDFAVFVAHPDHYRRGISNQAKALLAFPQFLLRLLAVGDIYSYAQHVLRLTVRRVIALARCSNMANCPVCPSDAELSGVSGVGSYRLINGFGNLLSILGVYETAKICNFFCGLNPKYRPQIAQPKVLPAP